MAKPAQSRGWRWCRRIFRAVRIAILLLVLLFVAAGAYLNEVGLPDFLKRPLLEKLRARGVDLQFTRLRLRWYRGVVAEQVTFGGARPETGAAGPQLRLKEVQLQLNHAALMKFHLSVDSLILHDGDFVWPLPETNQPMHWLAATNISAQLRFLTNDQWALDHLTGSFAGAKLQLAGAVTNVSALRDWKIFQPGPETGTETTRQRLRQLAETIEQLKFAKPPELTVQFNGDGRDPRTFDARLTLNAPEARTPWGTLTNGALLARLIAPDGPTNLPQIEFQLSAGSATTPWGGGANLQLALRLVTDESQTNLVHARLEATADRPATQWAEAATARLTAEWEHSPTNPVPESGTAELNLTGAHTQWGSAVTLRLNTRLEPPAADAPHEADEHWGWWAALEPYALDWDCRLQNVHVEQPDGGLIAVRSLVCGGLWRAPQLTVTNLQSELYSGGLDFRAALNVTTRALAFDGSADFDALPLAPLLPDEGRRWLEQYTWEIPPVAHTLGRVTLPEWTNGQPDWRGEVLPTLWLDGELTAGKAGFRGVPLSSAHFHFTLSNLVWNLPDLVAIRPEGRLEMAEESDMRSNRFHARFHSTMDLKAFRELLDKDGRRGLDFVGFSQPPTLDAEMWGHWHDNSQIGVQGHVVATNFTLRGESVSRFQGDVAYTNGFVVLTNGRAERGDGYMTATGLGVDIAGKKAFVTNGFSTMEAAPFFRIIGPEVSKVMEPYHFIHPPAVHAEGTIPLSEDISVANLEFKIEGGPFNWLNMNASHIAGWVDWTGQNMKLDVEQAAFYGGELSAAAAFDFTVKDGADFSFSLDVTNADLKGLMADIYPGTNQLEGRLSGHLNITRANSEDWHSWFGNGQVDLRDGLIWDIPIFGIFSPVLDSFQPGLGESRADQAAGPFTITNGVIRSDAFEIRAPVIRMEYRGTVDLGGVVNAVVEAKLLRGLPVVGPFVSLVLTPFTKLFEFKVTGTLTDPKKERVFILDLLFNPWEAIKGMMPGEKPKAPNEPPAQIKQDAPSEPPAQPKSIWPVEDKPVSTNMPPAQPKSIWPEEQPPISTNQPPTQPKPIWPEEDKPLIIHNQP